MKKKVSISHLVTNGCSFTYGDGLTDPASQAWPALLANKLGVPVANIALGGASNDRIYRKTVDYMFSDFGSNPFYIMGLTSFTRREEYSRTESDWIPLNLISNHRVPRLWASRVEELLAKEVDWIPLARKKLDIWMAIINLFRATDSNYLIADMIEFDHTMVYELGLLYPKLVEYVMQDSNHLANYLSFNRSLPKLPCGHDDEVAQVAIADYLYDAMMDRYDVTIAENHNHLRIKDFYTEAETNWAIGRNRGDWII